MGITGYSIFICTGTIQIIFIIVLIYKMILVLDVRCMGNNIPSIDCTKFKLMLNVV